MTKEKEEEMTKEKKFKIPADGTVVRGSDGAVYVIEKGKRRVVPNVFTYIRMGISADHVVQMKDKQIDAMPEGDDMPTLAPKKRK